MGVLGRCLHLRMTEKPADDGQALAERQCAGSPAMSEVVKPAQRIADRIEALMDRTSPT